MMVLLDTNICIYCLKNTYPELTSRLLSCEPDTLLISSITVFELEYGAYKSRWGDKVRSQLALFLTPFTIVPFTMKDAITAGQMRGYLAQQGTPIGPYDIQIAAQCLTRDVPLITHNVGEFSRVPGLRVEDWVESH